jgi:hypothetical protein
MALEWRARPCHRRQSFELSRRLTLLAHTRRSPPRTSREDNAPTARKPMIAGTHSSPGTPEIQPHATRNNVGTTSPPVKEPIRVSFITRRIMAVLSFKGLEFYRLSGKWPCAASRSWTARRDRIGIIRHCRASQGATRHGECVLRVKGGVKDAHFSCSSCLSRSDRSHRGCRLRCRDRSSRRCRHLAILARARLG